jgi:hypothetical protein
MLNEEDINYEKANYNTKVPIWPYPSEYNSNNNIYRFINWKDIEFTSNSSFFFFFLLIGNPIILDALERYKKLTFYNQRIPSTRCLSKNCIVRIVVHVESDRESLPYLNMDEKYSLNFELGQGQIRISSKKSIFFFLYISLGFIKRVGNFLTDG